MSDYLDRLVTRSFGLSPVVGPRLPSLFEPPRAADSVHVEPPHSTSFIEEADADAPTPHAARPSGREASPRGTGEGTIQPAQRRGRIAPLHFASSAPGEDATHETARTANAGPRQSRRDETQAPETLISPRAPRVAAEISGDYIGRLLTPPPGFADEAGRKAEGLAPHEIGTPPPARALSAPQREAEAAGDERASEHSSELERQVEGLRRQIEALHSRQTSAEQRTETQTAFRETFVERGAQAPASTPTPALLDPRTAGRARAQVPKSVVAQPRIAPYAGPRAAAAAQSNAPAPTINVTIGRIEVRAAPQSESQSQPERRSSHAPQAMNLQEYLRRRSGGHS